MQIRRIRFIAVHGLLSILSLFVGLLLGLWVGYGHIAATVDAETQQQQSTIYLNALQQQLATLNAQVHLNEALLGRYREQLQNTQGELVQAQHAVVLYQELLGSVSSPQGALEKSAQ